jgi:hypothetical protein
MGVVNHLWNRYHADITVNNTRVRGQLCQVFEYQFFNAMPSAWRVSGSGGDTLDETA